MPYVSRVTKYDPADRDEHGHYTGTEATVSDHGEVEAACLHPVEAFAADAGVDRLVARRLRKELEAGPAEGLRAFLDLWRKIVVDSDFHAGCPVLAVAIEEPQGADIPPALAAAAEVFEQWETLPADSLRAHGAETEQAAQLATLVVAAVEGTVAMCRAQRSTQPLDRTAEQLQALIAAATAK